MARECAIAALRTGLWLALLGAVAWKIWPSRAAAADDANVVGFVLTVSGDWTLEGDPPRAIKGGDRLPPTAEN